MKQFSQFKFVLLPVFHFKQICHRRKDAESIFPHFLSPSHYFFHISFNLMFNYQVILTYRNYWRFFKCSSLLFISANYQSPLTQCKSFQLFLQILHQAQRPSRKVSWDLSASKMLDQLYPRCTKGYFMWCCLS